jgi:tetraacyldisaccharide 4'-kinase
MLDINRHWYRTSFTWLTLLLLPLSGIFWCVMNLRRLLYWSGFKKKYVSAVPVIVVGNITVGGTGKTPFVIWLAHFLKEQGLKPGIVSRGYGGNEFSQAVVVSPWSDTRTVGDEAIVLARRANCPVVVCADRVAAVEKLLQDPDINIVISDDGLQHYRLQRQLEIVIADGARRFGNKRFLPAGPLREPLSRLRKADFIIWQQGDLQNEINMQLCGDKLIFLSQPGREKTLREFSGLPVHAVAGIGNPQRFFASLKQAGLLVTEHIFPDHYHYLKADLDFGDALPILMTEKDAVK